jgi:hypothetical protein
MDVRIIAKCIINARDSGVKRGVGESEQKRKISARILCTQIQCIYLST